MERKAEKQPEVRTIGARHDGESPFLLIFARVLDNALPLALAEHVLAGKTFDPKKCPEYAQKSQSMMANRDPEQGEGPMVYRGLKLIGMICK